MKLPNGYGSVKKLSGKRRRPWIIQVTTGWEVNETTGKQKQIKKTVGYAKTKAEGLQLLADYNNNPYDLTQKDITFQNIYDIWSERKYPKLSDSTVNSYKAAFSHCSEIADKPVQSLKAAELQHVLDSCKSGSNTKVNMKVVMRAVFQYALQNDIVDKDYTDFLEIEYSEPVIDRIPFSDEEINELWKYSDQYDVKIVLILLYTGMRVNELLKMPRECFHPEERYLEILKAKNKYSVRKVPVHDKIFDFLKYFYDLNGTNLITTENGFKVAYNNFAVRNFKRINEKLGTTHRVHDTRHTFVTKGRACGIDQLCLKKIIGHAPDSITESVYTHLTQDELLKEINKLKY